MKQYYVYIYSDPLTFVPFYVGKGHGDRDKKHLKRTDSRHFPNRIRKMLRESRIPLIERIYTSSEDFAYMLEVGLIRQFGRADLGKGSLLNETNGGDGLRGLIISESHKAKIAVSMLGKNKEPKTEACKVAMSLASKGKPKSEAHKIAMKNRRKRGPSKKKVSL